jgi:hypothetical protein
LTLPIKGSRAQFKLNRTLRRLRQTISRSLVLSMAPPHGSAGKKDFWE